MKAFEKEVRKISFSNKTEKEEFVEDVNVLLWNPIMNNSVHSKTIQGLYFLYLRLNANVNLFSTILNQNNGSQSNSGTLFNFFHELIYEDDLLLPKKVQAIEIFIKLCDTDIEKEDLKKLLKSNLLNDYSADQILKFSKMFTPNIISVIHFFESYANSFSKEMNTLVLNILNLIDPGKIDEKTTDDIHFFMENIVPHFIERFAHRMNQEQLFNHPDKFAKWFIVWTKHHYQVEEFEVGVLKYYKTCFPTIIKYVPEYVWWNDGLIYGGVNKKYHFGSNEFFFLATGGSVRKISDARPYTRRMAREFVQLRYDLNLGVRPNVYIYLFGKSLGGGEKLSKSLMRFMGFPKGANALKKEFDKWNPIIQKFSSAQFEAIVDEGVETLMGYIYHCLRDRPDYSVQGKTLEQIMHESDNYYRRILNRRAFNVQRIARRQEARMGKEEKPKLKEWPPQKKIKPFFKAAPKRHIIIELINENQLIHEGNVLQHCVGNYANTCMVGNISIWSFRYFENGGWNSKLTLEIQKSRIVQIRGKHNANPELKELNIIKRWASRESLVVATNEW